MPQKKNINQVDSIEIINCHTHVFHIDHVPNKFGRKLLPLGIGEILTIKFLKWVQIKRDVRRRRFFAGKGQNNYLIKTVVRIFNIPLKLFFWILRTLLKLILKLLSLEFLYSNETVQLANRFLLMLQYAARYKNQAKIFQSLKRNYPIGTKFVVLSMDMDYMQADLPLKPYKEQLLQLVRFKKYHKDAMLPFIFAHPERMVDENHFSAKLKYSDYFKKRFIDGTFHGIKIYPALGYYPFDERLIDIYEFAVKYEIPIMTHCVAGSVFYRGNKKTEWNEHPILRVKENKLKTPDEKNKDFSTYFTHPLNYECLLNRELLKRLINRDVDLSKLKICLAHFGGVNEWKGFIKNNTFQIDNNISPVNLETYNKFKNSLNHKGVEQIWNSASWLSIIYDLMVKYDNIYADISFILYEKDIFPLLKYMLMDKKVNKKILFGTDFYVLSQKSTDKEVYIKTRAELGEDLFNLIAVENPKRYLQTKL